MDKIKKTPKPSMTSQEEEQIRMNAEAAKSILESAEYEFFRNFIRTEKEKIIEDAVNNRLKRTKLIRDGQEIYYEKWEQEAEASGRFKLLFEIVNQLTWVMGQPAEVEKAKAEGRLEIKD